MNYRRRTDPIVIPYPYLTDTTELDIPGVSNVVYPVPAQLELGKWYLTTQSTTVPIPAGKSLVYVRVDPSTGRQSIVWDTAPSDAAQDRVLQTSVYFMVYDGTRIPLNIAGFSLLYLGDDSGSSLARSYLLFPPNIGFRFILASN